MARSSGPRALRIPNDARVHAAGSRGSERGFHVSICVPRLDTHGHRASEVGMMPASMPLDRVNRNADSTSASVPRLDTQTATEHPRSGGPRQSVARPVRAGWASGPHHQRRPTRRVGVSLVRRCTQPSPDLLHPPQLRHLHRRHRHHHESSQPTQHHRRDRAYQAGGCARFEGPDLVRAPNENRVDR